MRRTLIVVSLIATASLSAVALPVAASNRTDKPLKISDTERLSEQNNYPALIGNYNVPRSDGRRVDRCRTVTHCDVVPMKLEVPKSFGFYQVVFTLTWPGPDRTNEKGEVIRDQYGRTQKDNDLDLYLWEELIQDTEYATADQSATVCQETDKTCRVTVRNQIDIAATAWHPEFVGLSDAPPTSEVRDLPRRSDLGEVKKTEQSNYFVSPLNFRGTNAGYSLKAELDPQTIEEREALERQPANFPLAPGISRSGGPKLGAAAVPEIPEAKLDPVKVPGQDGPLTDQELLALKGVQAATRRGVPLWVPIALVTAVALAVGILILIRRRRGEAPTEV